MRASITSRHAKSLSMFLLKARAGLTYANVYVSTHLQAERQSATQSLRLPPFGLQGAARRAPLLLSKHSMSAATPSHKSETPCGARGMCSSSEVTWIQLPSGARMRELEAGDQGDTPVIEGQAVRVSYVARLDDSTVCGKGNLSFRIGNGVVCQAIEESAVGMCVGDRRLIRAPPFSRRGKYLASVPDDQLIEYEVMLTGAVHHMNIVTYVERGQDDPLDMLWNFTKRSFAAISGNLQKKLSK
mmetsp:Transcript_27262/g.59868  ORF Transcript_27262/g.59868 Transcript_27262/m.59868 type:complete len:243 (+) Transcript_27262:177-905(+)